MKFKKHYGFIALALLASQSYAEVYVGLGVGSTSGSGWTGESIAFSLGNKFDSGFLLELGLTDLGDREEWPNESVNGVSLEAAYSVDVDKLNFNFGGGLYFYDEEAVTGDASYKDSQSVPVATVAGEYKLTDRVAIRAELRKFYLNNSLGSPNRLSASLIYNF